ncbi:SprT family zinc-dependent metalloprotease [Curvibacter sp. APW13]|uniref:M48 family metallopeptidase n=1 Tax=Curvibacter sp. APW13 TaxID=3077236 RepID=UPI0028E089DA|nr:SprT family zinc-dependent metalloprotease [Curvibacter sp. APW13]MDT8989752.1 SprT family zinc-dependent metalloprotease [Curvibacter sp. APW13]
MHPLLRYTLDLFEDALTPPAPVQAGERTPDAKVPRLPRISKPFRAPAQENSAQAATSNVATVGLDRTASAASKPYHHPKANRKMQLKQVEVAYLYQKARRRTIGFSVGADGLVVRAPQWVSLADVDAALQVKGDWILRKLAVSQERELRQQQGALQWTHGSLVPYLGEPLQLVLDPTHSGAAQWLPAADAPSTSAAQLRIGLSQTADPSQVRDAVQAWLMRQARTLFAQSLDRYAAQLGVQWTKLTLTSAGTRWGSARVDGAIRLNWRLIHFRQPIIDYVVAHELSHLRVMDHSPRFWDTVRSVVPDYAAMRKALREDGGPRWD